ncbi:MULTISPECIES: hypothetical protein [Streptomyces]|uniref:Uncharacterized protein n=1 Tax=Streptomyces stelliscabiei TaxID=146820 RepID=A0A8I0PEU2_9ACTN|nr:MULTISPECIES: hypothetical protein [Streptomyces]MBE1601065.1 hypothetical protein [Streptomyces stelliscabiei]
MAERVRPEGGGGDYGSTGGGYDHLGFGTLIRPMTPDRPVVPRTAVRRPGTTGIPRGDVVL